eukprot:m.144177 g.144177  ORF g.144177 m.144177 type:complete len:51 (+) comp77672_c0_seq1:29-181(+)
MELLRWTHVSTQHSFMTFIMFVVSVIVCGYSITFTETSSHQLLFFYSLLD